MFHLLGVWMWNAGMAEYIVADLVNFCGNIS
jgi:hypothetical protein